MRCGYVYTWVRLTIQNYCLACVVDVHGYGELDRVEDIACCSNNVVRGSLCSAGC